MPSFSRVFTRTNFWKSQTLQPPLAKCQDIKERVLRILNASPRPASEWNTLLGKLAFLSQVVPEVRLHCRPTQCNLRTYLTSNWWRADFFPPIADPMLLGWLGVSHLLQGFVLSPFLQTMQLYIDANRRDGEPISWTWRMEISWEAIAHRCLLKSRLSWEWSLFPRQSARSKCEDSYK